MGTPLRPKYIPYTYMDPLGLALRFSEPIGMGSSRFAFFVVPLDGKLDPE